MAITYKELYEKAEKLNAKCVNGFEADVGELRWKKNAFSKLIPLDESNKRLKASLFFNNNNTPVICISEETVNGNCYSYSPLDSFYASLDVPAKRKTANVLIGYMDRFTDDYCKELYQSKKRV